MLLCSCVSPPAAFMCPGALQYQACLTACTAQSCPNLDFDSDPDQCSGLTEGCVCPEGTLLHRPYSALCIPPEKCGENPAQTGNALSFHGYVRHDCVCWQPAPTAPAFLVRTARFGKPRRAAAACTDVTTTPSSPWTTTAPAWRRPCVTGRERWSSAWLTIPAAARRKSAVGPPGSKCLIS